MNIHLKTNNAHPLPPLLLQRERGPEFGKSAVSRPVTLSIGRNGTIFDEGSEARFYYKVATGTVRLCKYFPDGRRQITAFFFAGDVFGIEGVSEYLFTAEAASDCVLIKQDRSELVSGAFPRTSRSNLSTLLYNRLSDAMIHLLMVGRQTVTERVSSFLLLLSDRCDQKEDRNLTLHMSVSRQDIADYLALTIETVCRSLSKLKRARIIDIPSAQIIVIRDIDRLRELAAGEI